MRHLDKIKKLLALAQDPGASPQEAETASRQAASLMAKHNLDMADLEAHELETEWDITESAIPGARPGKKDPRKVPIWIGIMAFGVALYTRTRTVTRGGMVVYRGARADVELAHWMLKALIDLAYNQSKGSLDPSAFRNGFAQAIQSRLKAMTRDRDQVETENPRALVVVDKLHAKLDELFGPQRVRRSYARGSQEGYAQGMESNLPTNRPITCTSRSLEYTAPR